ncbi:MAG: Zn-ribbon domain-containing protein [ANME-2 cluster archaeon]|nr:Zn-ribbon domain-containing protein [ANME-2 cluster archaeon]
MPHKCTRCENIFTDGAVEILNGCPSCGWNKFLYVRDESETPPSTKTEVDKQEPAKKFLKEIDEFLVDHGVEVEEKVEPEPDEDRIESVRIMAPGSYELNLDALLERKEIIMAMKEDGTYMVHLPSVFDNKKLRKKRKR